MTLIYKRLCVTLVGLCLSPRPAMGQEQAVPAGPQIGVGLKLGAYVHGLESYFHANDRQGLLVAYDRKGTDFQPLVESLSLSIRERFPPFSFEVGFSHVRSLLYSQGGTIEVERGYLGARFGLGLYLPFDKLYFSFRLAAVDLVIKETIDKSDYGTTAERSLPGRYAELLTVSCGYFFL